VRKIIDKCHSKAKTILTENISKLHKVAQTLLEKEKLDQEAFLEIIAET